MKPLCHIIKRYFLIVMLINIGGNLLHQLIIHINFLIDIILVLLTTYHKQQKFKQSRLDKCRR